MLDTETMYTLLDGLQRDIALNHVIGDVVRCINYGTQHFILEPLEDGDIGVTGSTPQLNSIVPNVLKNGLISYYPWII